MIKNEIRKLASIVIIDEILPAQNADRLEIAKVGGWQVVVGKDTFKAGDKAVFFEIDSQVPALDARFGLSEGMLKQAKNDENGTPRLTIKTAKLRGNLSQGMLAPARAFEMEHLPVGEDVTDLLNVTKKPEQIPTDPSIIGEFPTTLAEKSRSERIQNLFGLAETIREHRWIATEKIDGTSITVLNDGGQIRVAGRNYEVEADEHRVFSVIDKEKFLEIVPEGWSVQGELFGHGINGNVLKINGLDFRAFAVFNKGIRVPREDWPQGIVEIAVPQVQINIAKDFEQIIAEVDGMKSIINPAVLAEGIVFHEVDGVTPEGMDTPSIKVISNKFLMKQK